MKNILVTCALPYANGEIHLGHILEHIQADIWVRYNRMIGNKVYFICADDSHGTAIMLKAKKENITPEKMIKYILKKHKRDLNDFNIKYDNYYYTHSKENQKMINLIFKRLKKKKLISSHYVFQLYDQDKKMFLPDRFVTGKCPKCKSPNQYGDNCDICGFIYNAKDLINPISIISNSKPIMKKSKHFFFKISYFKKKLKNWIYKSIPQTKIINKITEWFNLELKDWNISRDAPYFGFKIPNTKNKYFYVWMDATIGYISTFKNLCNKNKKINFKKFWSKDSNYDLYHFIGKDIIYFHSIFWPAILDGSDFRKPTKLFVHGHLKINGYKMSKSKKNFITAKSWLKNFDSDSIRYYFASKLSFKIDDIDLNISDFIKKVNSDIVNKIINLAARNAKLINKKCNGILSNEIYDNQLYQTFVNVTQEINDYFNNLNFNKVIKKVIYLTNLANKYIDKKSPWKISKQNNIYYVQNVCSMGINLFRIIMIFMKPIVPNLSKKTEIFLNEKLKWENINSPLLNHKISHFKNLYSRIDINKMNLY